MPRANAHSTTRARRHQRPAAAIAAQQYNRTDTVKIADRLNDIAGRILLADLAVAGLGDDADLYRGPAVSALRELLVKLAKKVNKIANDIHPGPPIAA